MRTLALPTTCRTLQLLRKRRRPLLLVSLPANDLDLARAAQAGGAEALKVHLNIRHAAAGVQFGSLDEEADQISRIVELGLPLGLVPGDETAMVSFDDMARLANLGVDFCDAYLAAMPAWMLQTSGMGIMAALGNEDMANPARLQSLAAAPVQMIEASIVPHAGYGRPLSVADLTDYTTVVRMMAPAGKPVIVPTQRRVLPEDLVPLAGTGIGGLLIGAIVTGREPQALETATRHYREALEQLS